MSTTTIPYDYMVYAVGAEVQTFGIPGVKEHACFMKEIGDAERVSPLLSYISQSVDINHNIHRCNAYSWTVSRDWLVFLQYNLSHDFFFQVSSPLHSLARVRTRRADYSTWYVPRNTLIRPSAQDSTVGRCWRWPHRYRSQWRDPRFP